MRRSGLSIRDDGDVATAESEVRPSEGVRPDRLLPSRAADPVSRLKPSLSSSSGWITTAAALLAVLPYLYDLARTLLDEGHGVQWGDGALEALATRDVWRWHQVLGPYSRYGWHHPGPALFYWLALPDRLLGSGGPGIEVGIILLNGAAAGAIVLVLGRHWGPWLAVWASACVSLLHVVLGGAIWRDLWNPYVVIMPMALLVVLAADAATGRVASWCWALVVASFTIQTHVSTAPAAVVLLALSLAGLVWGWRARRRFELSVRWAGAGLVVAALLWVPPLIDAVRHHPSNLSLMVKFFRARHPVHSLFEAARTSLSSVSVVIFGRQGSPATVVIRSTSTLVVSTLGLLLLIVMIIAIAWLGLRHGSRLGLWLMSLSVIGFVVATFAGTRVVGDIAQYLTIWQVCLPITLLLALGAVILRENRPANRSRPQAVHAPPQPTPLLRLAQATSITAALGALICASIAISQESALASPTHYPGYPPPGEVSQATYLVRTALRPSDRVVRLTITTQSAWPTVAGVALELERGGRRTTEVATPGSGVDAILLFGANRRPSGHEDVDVEFQQTGPDEVQGTPARGRPLGSLGSLIAFINRPAP
jgi:hypothetical protein